MYILPCIDENVMALTFDRAEDLDKTEEALLLCSLFHTRRAHMDARIRCIGPLYMQREIFQELLKALWLNLSAISLLFCAVLCLCHISCQLANRPEESDELVRITPTQECRTFLLLQW